MNRIIKNLILVLIFSMPLVFIPVLRDAFALPKVSLLRIFAVLFAVWLISQVRKIKFNTINLSVAAYLCMRIVATIFSENVVLSWHGRYLYYFEGTLQLISYIVIFLTIQFLLKQDKSFERDIYHAIGYSCGVVGIYGIIQYLGLDPVKWDMYDGVVISSFGNPSFLAGFLVLCLPVVYGEYLKADSTKTKILFGVIGILNLVNLMLTGSRAGLLGIAGGMIILIFIIQPVLSRKILPVIFIAFIVLLMFALFGGRSWRFQESGIKSRFMGWNAALNMIKKKPVLGYGPDTFGEISVRYLPYEYSKLTKVDASPGYAHNIFLDQVVSSGLLGLGAFCWVLLSCFYKKSKVRPYLTAAISGGLIYGFFSIGTLSFWLYFWVYLGIMASVVSQERGIEV